MVQSIILLVHDVSTMYKWYASVINITNLNLMQPVPLGGAVHISSTQVLSALLVWVAADCKITQHI